MFDKNDNLMEISNKSQFFHVFSFKIKFNRIVDLIV